MEEILRARIERLRKEINELENQSVPNLESGTLTFNIYDRGLGGRVPMEQVGLVSRSEGDINKDIRAKELRLFSLRSELKKAEEELFLIEYDKPANVSKRQAEEFEEKKDLIKEKRLMHEERYKNLNILLDCLRRAGMYDLASRLSDMRFAFKKRKDPYVISEIELQEEEKSLKTKTITTGKESRQIRRGVIRLTVEATRNAKRYKDLYHLFISAELIVRDLRKREILDNENAVERAAELRDYFATSDYLAFYRDSYSDYNKAIRSHRL